MSTVIQSGQMYVIDDSVEPPEIVFDSDERLFHCTDFVAGSVSIPQRQCVTTPDWRSPANVSVNHAVAAVNADADIVLGSFRVTTFGGSQGISGLGVFNAGGTYVHYLGGGQSPSTGVLSNSTMLSYAGYTFIASAGSLVLHERVYLDIGGTFAPLTHTVTLLPIQFDYKLFVGTLN